MDNHIRLTDYEMELFNELSPEEKRHLKFPRSLVSRTWRKYLKRNLTPKEYYILENYKTELKLNKDVSGLHEKCFINNLYVPLLSNSDGNCMFQSLNYHKIGSSIVSLRRGLATIMYLFKDQKNFIWSDTTLKEMFDPFNDIEYVARNIKSTNEYGEEVITKKFYKYTFNIMCQDLSNNYSWGKLPTELILRVISYLYKVEIVIINSSPDSVDITINSHQNVEEGVPALRRIYLGQLDESHYLPIEMLKDGEEAEPIFYMDAHDKFFAWADNMEVMMKRYYLSSFNIDNNIDMRDYRTDDIKKKPQGINMIEQTKFIDITNDFV